MDFKNFLKNKKNYWIIGGVALVIIVAVLFLAKLDFSAVPGNGQASPTAIKSLTMSDVPEGVKVPEMGEEAEGDVAVPEGVASASTSGSNKFRIFSIKAEGDKYSPNTIIVNVGDIIHINFSAVDKTYDLTIPDYGMKQTAEKGETKILEFQAGNTGKFAYYCEVCGGLDSGVKGYIIIAK
jgi:plastocyanin